MWLSQKETWKRGNCFSKQNKQIYKKKFATWKFKGGCTPLPRST